MSAAKILAMVLAMAGSLSWVYGGNINDMRGVKLDSCTESPHL